MTRHLLRPGKVIGVQTLSEGDRGGLQEPVTPRMFAVGIDVTGANAIQDRLNRSLLATVQADTAMNGSVNFDETLFGQPRTLMETINVLGHDE